MIVGHVLRRLVGGTLRGMLRRWPTTLLTLILLGAGVSALGARGLVPGLPAFGPGMAGLGVAAAGGSTSTDVREMTVEDIRPARGQQQANGPQQINLILKEKSGNRRLVMAVEINEALSIAADVGNQRTSGPMTFDLMRSLVREMGGTLNRVVVNNVTDTTFYAKVMIHADDRQIELDSRPSDAIALAVRSKVPIFAEASVLDKAGTLNPN